jgi:hypothetical protein
VEDLREALESLYSIGCIIAELAPLSDRHGDLLDAALDDARAVLDPR